ncbi:MAG: TrkA family potassium uptake protein [Halorientalis sp.]
MDTWQRRTVAYVAGLVAVVFAYALAYDYGMSAFEGEPQSFLHSLEIVVETFTTTGYGSDAPWSSPEMTLLAIAMQATGVFSIFLALPVLLFPLFEEMVSTTVPTAVEDVDDHVVVCTLTPRGETLIAELDSKDVPYVVVEPDRERATDHYEAGFEVVHADPQSVEGLRGGGLSDARAVVADASDDVNTSVILTAKEVAEDVPTISVVNEPERARYHELAGADAVLSPRSLLGESLASKVTAGVSTDGDGGIEVGEDFELAEFPIHRASDLVGSTLAESRIREETGVNVIGAWFRGRFESPLPPDAELDGGTVLLATGREDQLAALRDLTKSDARSFGRGETVVVGHGEVGESVVAALAEAGIPHTVVDLEDKPGVDVVGDATDPETLRQARIESVHTLILALPDDTATEVTTLVARDLRPDLEIVARAEESENVRKIYRAGADYVLSLAAVSGRMLASTVLEETVVSPHTQVEVVRTSAPGLVGTTLGEADVRQRTGCTVVGVERDGTVRTDVGPDFRVEAGDDLIVAGTDAGTNRFVELLG